MRRSPYFQSKISERVQTLKDLRDQGLTWKEISALLGASESAMHRDWATGRGELAAAHSRRNRTLLEQASFAPCHDDPLPGFLGNPWDSEARPPRWADPEQTYVAWLLCSGCSFRQGCIELTRPEGNHFEGVCGGQIWVDGRDRTDAFLGDYGKMTRNEHGELIDSIHDPQIM